MPIKSILMPLAINGSDVAATRVGVQVAARLGAHLQGIALVPDLTAELMRAGNELVRRVQSVHVGFQMPEGGMARVVAEAEARQMAEIATLRAAFACHLQEARLPLLDAGSTAAPAASFAEVPDEPHGLAQAALLADLVVLPRALRDHHLDAHAAVDVLFLAGRPVLLVPEAASGTCGRHVVIAWNASARAARAVSRAVPFLERAEAVTILEIIGSHPGPGPDALALYLARQGIRASQVRVPAASGESTALQLTREARQAGGDLLVIGGYGHSRLREMVLGSVTEQMIAQAAMPVFINH